MNPHIKMLKKQSPRPEAAMADLPKIDSAGLRLAKLKGAERVSSVTRIAIQEGKTVTRGRSHPLHPDGVANASRVVRPTTGRKEDR